MNTYITIYFTSYHMLTEFHMDLFYLDHRFTFTQVNVVPARLRLPTIEFTTNEFT